MSQSRRSRRDKRISEDLSVAHRILAEVSVISTVMGPLSEGTCTWREREITQCLRLVIKDRPRWLPRFFWRRLVTLVLTAKAEEYALWGVRR